MFEAIFHWLNVNMTDPVFYCGEMAHALGGYAILTTLALFTRSMKWVWGAWLVFLGATLFKEFYWDTHWEVPVQDFKGGMHDFLSYQVGAVLALGMSWFKIVAHPVVVAKMNKVLRR